MSEPTQPNPQTAQAAPDTVQSVQAALNQALFELGIAQFNLRLTEQSESDAYDKALALRKRLAEVQAKAQAALQAAITPPKLTAVDGGAGSSAGGAGSSAGGAGSSAGGASEAPPTPA